MTPVDFEAHDAAMAAAIAAAGLPAAVARKPDDSGWVGVEGESDFAVYAVVHPQQGGSRTGGIVDAHREVQLPYLITCVADTAQAARSVARDVDEALLTGVTVEGRNVVQVRPDGDGGIRPDDTTAGPPLFYATPRYVLWTSPTAAV